jgi:G6PDH family F420-dependent oxidoreductase
LPRESCGVAVCSIIPADPISNSKSTLVSTEPRMLEIGYTLSSEEFPALELVRQAKMAKDAGFSFATISDHYHPWTHGQGNSPFAWSTLGAIAHATERIRVGTGVTCPTMRVHPAIIAQAAATVASLMPGRFMLGLGTGENLNEHICGARWPSPAVRIEMLSEAVELIRALRGWNNMYAAQCANHPGVRASRRSVQAALWPTHG